MIFSCSGFIRMGVNEWKSIYEYIIIIKFDVDSERNDELDEGRAGVEGVCITPSPPLRVSFSSRPRDHAAHLANVQYYTSKGNLRGRVLTGWKRKEKRKKERKKERKNFSTSDLSPFSFFSSSSSSSSSFHRTLEQCGKRLGGGDPIRPKKRFYYLGVGEGRGWRGGVGCGGFRARDFIVEIHCPALF